MDRIRKILFWSRGSSDSVRGKAFRLLVGFLLFMLVFTILSRTAFGMTIPKVEVESPVASAISFSVKSSGTTVSLKNEIIHSAAGLLVSDVYVRRGEQIQAGDALYALHMASLETALEQSRLDLKKLDMQIEEKRTNQGLESANKDKTLSRARSDYTRTQTEQDITVSRTKKAMDAAQAALEEFKKNPDDVAPDPSIRDSLSQQIASAETQLDAAEVLLAALPEEQKAGQALRIAQRESELSAVGEVLSYAERAEIEEAVEAEYAGLFQDANAQVIQAEDAVDTAKSALQAYDRETAAKEQMTKQERENALTDTYEQQKSVYEDACRTREQALESASRTVADAGVSNMADSSLASMLLDRDAKCEEVESLEALVAVGGVVYSAIDATITEVSIQGGQSTSGGPVIIAADLSGGCSVSIPLTKEQIKYVKEGDAVELRFGETGESLGQFPIHSIVYMPDDSGKYEVEIRLPANRASVGREILLETSIRSARYSMVIPLSAIHEGANGQKYVLYIREVTGFLGSQLCVEKADITIDEKNDTLAAITSYDLDKSSQIVTGSSRALSPGDIVKIEG